MKRAWPYAVALAVVVTGCYLALAPLLRSISPGAPSAQTSSLATLSGTETVPQAKIDIVSKKTGSTVNFSSLLHAKHEAKMKAAAAARQKAAAKKAAAAAKKREAAKRRRAAEAQQFATSSAAKSNNTSSAPTVSTSPTRTTPITTTPAPTKTTTLKPATTKTPTQRTASVGGGQVDQADNAGLAGHDKGETSVSGGTSGQIAN